MAGRRFLPRRRSLQANAVVMPGDQQTGLCVSLTTTRRSSRLQGQTISTPEEFDHHCFAGDLMQ